MTKDWSNDMKNAKSVEVPVKADPHIAAPCKYGFSTIFFLNPNRHLAITLMDNW